MIKNCRKYWQSMYFGMIQEVNMAAQTGTRKRSDGESHAATSRTGKSTNSTGTNSTSRNASSKASATKPGSATSGKTSPGRTSTKSISKTSTSGRAANGSGGNKKAKTSKSKKGSQKAVGKKKKYSLWEEYDFPIVREIIRWMLAAFSIILFISSFEQMEGNLSWLKKINFGLFGWGGYISVLLTIYIAFFIIPEIGRAKAWIRTVAVLLVTASLCGMMQIFSSISFNAQTSMVEYYAMGYAQGGGGIFGGAIVKWLYPWFGSVGTGILLIFLVIIGTVILSERSGMAFLKNATTALCEDIKYDMEEYRIESEARAEERQKKKEIRQRAEEEARARKAEAWEQVQKEGRTEEKNTKSEEEHVIERKTKVKTRVKAEEKNNSKEVDHGEAQWQALSSEEEDRRDAALFEAQEEYMVSNLEEAEEYSEPDSYVKHAVEVIRKRMARKKELEEAANKPLMEWSDTTEDTPYNNPVDYGNVRDKYSNISGSDEIRSAVAGTRTVVTANGKVIVTESDEIPPAVKKRTIPGKAAAKEKGISGELTEKVSNKDLDNNKANREEAILPKPYCFPSLELLNQGDRKSNGKSQEKELQQTADILEQTFRDFGVGVTVKNYSCGPTVTRYELEPDQGVKVSRITGLTDDIKLKLAATDIRIEAPIPGKAAIGIEVPNKENSMVVFRDLIESDAFQRHPSRLAFAVGKDIGGKVIVFDIAKMPHVLIAGATGSGKSVCINTLIMSILYKAEPSEVKLIMVDPKVVELSVYNGIPHLLIPVVTDPKKAAGALNWAVAEMTRRYQLFAETVTRDLAGYNRKAKEIRAELEKEGLSPEKIQQEGPEILPQIVIIVDELADLMMVAPGEVEDAICRLAQMARAAGLHLVLATQRPSVNVITGLIKANVPSRIAFSVSSGIDSRTILDMNGAEKLLGKGDMLFAPFGYNKPVRVQGAFISEPEVASVVSFLKAENDSPVVQETKINLDLMTESGNNKDTNSERDEYFEKAAYFIIKEEEGSIGGLQRLLKIGFNRAARIMDQLEEAGVVSPQEGKKPRKVIMSLEEFQHYMENNS